MSQGAVRQRCYRAPQGTRGGSRGEGEAHGRGSAAVLITHLGVASDVIGYPITRFAVRLGLPGRPVPHGRRGLQTAHAAGATTVAPI